MKLIHDSTDRRAGLRFRIERLGGRIARLETRSQRFIWYRLGLIVGGGVFTWLGATSGQPSLGWGAFSLSVVIFMGVVLLHRQLDSWINSLKIWMDIRNSQLARSELAWDRLPGSNLPPGRRRSALEIDLDLTGDRSLHQLLDITISPGGSQLLADWITQTAPDTGEIARRQSLVQELASMGRFRDRLLLAFRLVTGEQLQGEHLLGWLSKPYPAGRLRWVLPVAAGLVAANQVLFILNSAGQLPAYWILSLSLYIVFYFYNIQNLNQFLEAVVRLDLELDKLRVILNHLERYPLTGRPALQQLCASFHDPGRRPSRLIRRIKLATAAVGLRSNLVLGFLVNLVLPWDFIFAALAGRFREEASRTLPAWLKILHELEALVCLAEFADLHPEFAYPEITPDAEPVFEAEALGHPLLPPASKVVNDLSVGKMGEIVIITGSNMAGKSTFIKTIGINLCLAYAGAPVNAAQFRSLPFCLHTCIRISDSLGDGYSYFYAEVQCLKKLLERIKAAGPLPVLFLVDEIFRGTNNRERLIGSRSYLGAVVGAGCVGFLATHDLELANLAERRAQVRNFHFRDRVVGGKLEFDYLIRPGPSPTTNALAIMRLEGLPVEADEDSET